MGGANPIAAILNPALAFQGAQAKAVGDKAVEAIAANTPKPDAAPPPPPMPSANDATTSAAQNNAAKDARQKASRGRAATLLTGSGGLSTAASTTGRTLLGA